MIGKIVSVKESIIYVQLSINIYQTDNLVGNHYYKSVLGGWLWMQEH